MGAGHSQAARRHDAAAGRRAARGRRRAGARHLSGDSLDKAGAANPNPGSVRIHRLNRAEYANAMRDLFGLDVDAAALLPNDDISDGFDNIASALKVSPSFLDQYIMAARALAKQAVGTPASDGQTRRRRCAAWTRACRFLPALAAASRHSSWRRSKATMKSAPTGNPAVFTVDGAMVDTQGRTHLTAGNHTVVMANAGRSFVESEGALFGFVPGAAGTGYASTGTLSPRHHCRRTRTRRPSRRRR